MILRMGGLNKGLMKSRLEEVILTQTVSNWKQVVLEAPANIQILRLSLQLQGPAPHFLVERVEEH